MQPCLIFFLMLYVAIENLTLCLTTSPVVSPNTKYTYGGRISMYTKSVSVRQAQVSVSVPYRIAFNSSIIAFVNFDQLSFDLQLYYIYIKVGYISTSSMNILVQAGTNQAGTIRLLSFRYFVANKFYLTPSFSSYSTSISPNKNISSSTPYWSLSSSLVNVVNMTGGITIFSAFTGINILAINSSYIFDLYIQIAQVNSSTINVTLSSQSLIPTLVYRVDYLYLAFNIGMANNPSFGSFILGSLTASSLGGTQNYTNSSNIIMQFNTFVGLSGFSLSGSSILNFNISINEPNNIQAIVSNSYIRYTFNCMVILTYYCSSQTPYLFAANNSCFDICPVRYYGDNQLLVCSLCPYDCYTCSQNGQCLTCNATVDFRELDTSSNRCVPLSGYYDNGQQNTTAQLCISNCVNTVACLQCNNGNICINNSCLWQINSSNTTPLGSNATPLSSNTTSLGLIIGTSIGIVGLIILIIIIIYFLKRNQRIHYEDPRWGARQNSSNLNLEHSIAQGQLAPIRPNVLILAAFDNGIWRDSFRVPDDYYCSICLDSHNEVPLITLACSHYHIFHMHCILQWKIRNSLCPLCKTSMGKNGRLNCFRCRSRSQLVNLNRGIEIIPDYMNRNQSLCPECRRLI